MPEALNTSALDTSDADIAEIKRLREIEEIKQLRSQDPWAKAQEGLEGIGGAVMSGVGAVSSFVDKYNPLGAPLRAAVGAAQDDKPVVEAYANQFLREPETAPSGKQIMTRLGVSDKDFNTPLISNPFTSEHFKVSPAGIAGGVAETALDPTNYIPGELAARGAAKGAALVEKIAPRAAEGLGRFAEERAIKAATGENRGAIRKLARVKGQTGGDVDKAIANLRKGGRTLLEADEAGAPAVGWFSNAEGIGREAEAKRQFYGKNIGDIGSAVDRLNPGAIKPSDLALDVSQFQREIPDVGKSAPIRKRVAEESARLQRYGIAEDEFGPVAPISFAEAQKIKGQYPWNPISPDVLISDKDATNRINRIVSERMDQAVEGAKAPKFHGEPITPIYRGEPIPEGGERIIKEGGGERIVRTVPSEEDARLLNQYGPAKEKYGIYKNVSDAGTEQSMRTLGRRMISPSSHAMGIGTGVSAAQEGLRNGGLLGVGAALVNQVALSRGSAFAARTADAISKKLITAPGSYKKGLPIMQKAARGGNAAVVATHQQLMANDPDYRRLMSQEP